MVQVRIECEEVELTVPSILQGSLAEIASSAGPICKSIGGRLVVCEELATNVVGTTYTYTSPDDDYNHYWVVACNSGGCTDVDSDNPATFVGATPHLT